MSTKNSRKRSSDADVLKRRQLGLQIIKDHNYDLSEKFFKQEYSKRIEQELSESASTGKIKRDIDWIIAEVRTKQPSFEFTTKPLRKNNTKDYINPLEFFEKDITEIHLNFADRTNAIIFDIEQKQLGTDSFVKKAIKQIPENIPENSPIVLRIFFGPLSYRGIETVICDIYEKSPEHTPLNIISTHTKHRCAEIEVKKSDILPLLNFTYKLFNRYWKTRIKKINSAKNRNHKNNEN